MLSRGTLNYKIIIVFLSVIVPLIGLLMINNNYAIQLIKQQVTEANYSMLQWNMNQLEASLMENTKHLNSVAYMNSDLVSLNILSPEDSQYFYKQQKVRNALTEGVTDAPWVEGYFVYVEKTDDFISTALKYNDYYKRLSIISSLKQAMQEQHVGTGWFAYSIGDEQRLVQIVRSHGDIYSGLWVDINSMKGLSELNYVAPDHLVLVADSGAILNETNLDPPILELMQDQHFRSGRGNYETIHLSQTYLLLSEYSSLAGFHMIQLLPENELLQHLPYFQKIIYFVPFIVFAVLILMLIMIRHIVMNPIYALLRGMRLIKKGQWEYRLEAGNNKEFRIINQTFNEMADEIVSLKISVYEEQLRRQQTEIERLQSQIHPHFLLNSLNMVYNLSQKQNFRMIQNMMKHLMSYLRFLLHGQGKYVRIDKEVAHIEHYLAIQTMRFGDKMSYQIDMDPALSELSIPPVIFQPFVENAIIHGFSMDGEPFVVRIILRQENIGGVNGVQIIIADNGAGFDEDVLQQLNENMQQQSENRRIGIQNVRERLDLYYGQAAKLQFSNRLPRGAEVSIYFPIIPVVPE